MAGFDLLFTVEADGGIPVSKYRSESSGLSVFLAQVEGPLVNGYFCLATEAHDDDGLPHTLEHLIFLGSEEYPFKGVLDLLANRSLASGTNAWTDTDHTCYTMTNAGSEGFLNLLPVYLDHILYPTLKESGFVTEVHHINGEGENAGVVYCEMQGRENSGESLTHLAMVRAMYPGRCGYKSETGGIMANLRDSTSHLKVCDYHSQFYRPENLCLVVTGQVKPEELLSAIANFEAKIAKKGPRGDFTRPWQSSVPPLLTSSTEVVLYPSDEETHGLVLSAWRGPKAKDKYTYCGLLTLMDYLTDSAISPVQRDFIEIPDPYCSQVHCNIIENSECCVYISFKNVPKDKLKDISPRLNTVLEKLASRSEIIDMTRIQNLLHRKILEMLNSMEDSPHEIMAVKLIEDFLFGDCEKDLEERVNSVSIYKRLKKETGTYWVDLLNQFFCGKSNVVIIGEPSSTLMEDMASTEKARVAEQRSRLGEEGLANKAKVLENAIQDNEVEPPEGVLTSLPVPDVSSINFHPIKSSSNKTETDDSNPGFPLADIPFRFQLDDTHTNFIQISCLLDSSCLSTDQRLLLPLFCEVMFESPILRDGELVSHEAVISGLEADTLFTATNLGVHGRKFSCGDFPQIVHITMKVEEEKQQTENRCSTNGECCPIHEKEGPVVARTLLREILFSKDSNHHTSSMLRQQKFLADVMQQLDKEPEKITEKMAELCRLLTSKNNLRVHLTANVNKLTALCPTPQKAWQHFVPESFSDNSHREVMKMTYEYVNADISGQDQCVIVGIGAVESSFMLHVGPSVHSHTHEDLPAILVFIQYLTQCEGPMWQQIRGLGLSYHYSMYTSQDCGLLYFFLAKSTHIVNAYKEGKKIIMGYVSGETGFSEVELESARSSLIFEIIEQFKTVSDVTNESLLNHFRGLDHKYRKELLQSVAKVTIADLQRVGTKHIAALFDQSKMRCAICCNPSKVQELVEGFKELSVDLKVIPSLDSDNFSSY
ncbi:hypothetical protein ScPMuIL_010774 [Solemya velum]